MIKTSYLVSPSRQIKITVNGILMGYVTHEVIDDYAKGPAQIIACVVPQNVQAVGDFRLGFWDASSSLRYRPNGAVCNNEGEIIFFDSVTSAKDAIIKILVDLGIDKYDEKWKRLP
jgi:hypothetical protein